MRTFVITAHKFGNQHVVIVSRGNKSFVYRTYFKSAVKALEHVARVVTAIAEGKHANKDLWTTIERSWMQRHPAQHEVMCNDAGLQLVLDMG